MTDFVYQGIKYNLNPTYSNKDMTGWDLSGRKDMNNIVIHGLCLSWETPNAQALPPDLHGTTFIMCNLDNVFVPLGNTVIDCSVRCFKAQNDLEDWHVDPQTLQPLTPLHPESFTAVGLSIDPKDIPATKMDICATQKASIDIAVAQKVQIDAAIATIDAGPVAVQVGVLSL